jgi:enamine deaminase RidA (YjgF/YER057c/UK114 family)
MRQSRTLRLTGTEKGAATDGTWAQVTRKGNLVFISGQVGLDKKGELPKSRGFEAQARLALDNLVAVLEAAGGSLEDLMMITVFVTDMANRPTFAWVRDAYFRANPPASTIVEIKRLFMDGVLVEVNGIAVLD